MFRVTHRGEEIGSADTIEDARQIVAGQLLAADMATAAAHAHGPVAIGSRACTREDALDLLGHRLKSLPGKVHETRRYPLGVYRGLAFGIVLHHLDAPEAYLECRVMRHAYLSRDSHGPRAVLNALDRLIGSYDSQAADAAPDLAIAQGQLRDYDSRLGQPFAHEAYLAELTTARDRLKAALSGTAPEPGSEPLPPASELAERIKSLKSAHSIEPAPQRAAARRIAAEEPVTARLRRRIDPPLPEPTVEPEAPAATVEPPPTVAPLPQAEPVMLTLPAPARLKPTHRDRITTDRRRPPLQMSLW